MNPRRHWREVLLVLGDAVLLNVGLWLALSVRHGRPATLEFFADQLRAFNLVFLLWFVGLYISGLYDLRRMRSVGSVVSSILVATLLNLTASVVFFYFFYPYRLVGMTPKTHLVLAAVLGHGLVLLWRRLVIVGLHLGVAQQRVAFLGNDPYIREIRQDLLANPHLGYVPVPFRSRHVNLVVADGRWADRHWDLVRGPLGRLIRRRVPILSLPAFYESLFGKVMVEHAASTTWLFRSVLSRTDAWYQTVKRIQDFAIAALLLVLLSVPLTLVALCIRLCDGAPVFFGQRRVGFMGAEITVWKFRTMAREAEARGPFAGRVRGRREPISRLGGFLRRWRLDELPQLWNVLRGDMSLVGPRPEWTREVEVLERGIPHYALRHLVRPGITGWAQLNYRATRDPKDSVEKFRFDLFYIEHCSLDLDLTILLRTIRRVFVRDAAVAPAHTRRLHLSWQGALEAGQLGWLVARRPSVSRDRLQA